MNLRKGSAVIGNVSLIRQACRATSVLNNFGFEGQMYSSLCNFLFQVIIIAIYAGTEHTVSIALQMRSPSSWLFLLHIKNAVRGNEGLQPPINRLSHLRVKWYTRRLLFVFAHLHLDQDRYFPEVRRLHSVLTFFHLQAYYFKYARIVLKCLI